MDAQKIVVDGNYKVTLHRNLIEAEFTHTLTIVEQRILYTAISNIPAPEFKKDEKNKFILDDNGKKIISNLVTELPKFEMSLKEFADLVGLKEVNYRSMKKVSENFMSKVINVARIDSEKKKNSYRHIQWICESEYLGAEGLIRIELSPKLLPYVANLTENFSSVTLASLTNFKCKYSTRLYFLMKQWEKIGKKDFTLDEIRKIIGVPTGKLVRYPHLKQRALQPAIDEINSMTEINVNLEMIKRGFDAVGVRFKIEPKTELKAEPKVPKMPEPLKAPETIYDEIAQSISYLNFNKEAYTNIAKRLQGIENIESIKGRVILELNRLAAYIEESGNLGAGFAIKEVEKAVMRFTIEQSFNFNDLIEGTKPKANVRPQGKNKELVPDWFYEQKQEQAAKQPVETPVTTGEMDFEAERTKILAMLGKTAN